MWEASIPFAMLHPVYDFPPCFCTRCRHCYLLELTTPGYYDQGSNCLSSRQRVPYCNAELNPGWVRSYKALATVASSCRTPALWQKSLPHWTFHVMCWSRAAGLAGEERSNPQAPSTGANNYAEPRHQHPTATITLRAASAGPRQ